MDDLPIISSVFQVTLFSLVADGIFYVNIENMFMYIIVIYNNGDVF